MASTASVIVAASAAPDGGYCGATSYTVQTPAGVLYVVYVDRSSDLAFRKSTDGGFTWSAPTAIFAGTVGKFAVWYDRWSGIAAGLIHLAYTDTATLHDILYRSIDTENSDTLSTQTTVFDGASATAASSSFSMTRTRGGNLIVAGAIDAGVEDGAWKSTDVGATWGAAIADPSEGATNDCYLLLPGWNADTNDAMLIFWDSSASEISVKRYDDSANSWAETSIATSMTQPGSNSSWPHYSAAVDLENSRNVLVAWSNVDTLNADLRCFTLTDTTITEVTNVVLNSTDDQGLCAISIDPLTGKWRVFYVGKSDGTETYNTAVNVYYKASLDSGSTWGAETQVSQTARKIIYLMQCPRFNGFPLIGTHDYNFSSELAVFVPTLRPRAQSLIGI